MTPAITRLLLALLLAAGSARAAIEPTLLVPQALVNEPVVLNIQIPGEEPGGEITREGASPLTFSSLQPDVINRQIFSANLTARSRTAGTFTLPQFTVPLKAGPETVPPLSLEVFPLERITWNRLTIGGESYRIGSALLVPSGKIYEGQAIPVTAKILVPAELPLFSYGHAEIEKENIGIWRLDPARPPNYDQRVEPRSPNATKPQPIIVDGESYRVVNFTTFASPLKAGQVKVGPGTVRQLQVQVTNRVERNRGMFTSTFSRSVSLQLDLPEVSFTAQALPAGAPASFAGAIGSFSLDTSLDGETAPQPGDPIQVRMEVEGKGNLATLPAPVLDAAETSWKVYPASSNEQLSQRHGISGRVVFTQLLRPLVAVTEVPSFVFSFFDPSTERYETLRSSPIPVTLTPATSTGVAPTPGLIPVPEMTDILGLIEPRSFQPGDSSSWLVWWQILPALVALYLAYLAGRRHLPRFIKSDPAKTELQHNLGELEQTRDGAEFLRRACSLAEREGLATSNDTFLTELFEKRDRACFQPDGNRLQLDDSERRQLLSGLRERLLGLILVSFTLFSLGQSEAAFHEEAVEAWNQGEYEKALQHYQLSLKEQETPDLFFNIGNCYYRLDEPGKAALSYRRALKLDPDHAEARQNLSFLTRKLGSIPPLPDQTPTWARWLSLPLLDNLFTLSCWLIAISILLRFAFGRRTIRAWSTVGLAIAAFLILTTLLLKWKHPGDTLRPPAPNAVFVVDDPTPLRTEASSAGSKILDVSPATACQIVAERGEWSYVELPDTTRGWVKADKLERI
ncbi:MAG: tetratricopeptide repeat protein [Verrucomicrobiota bacterium JB023]|nr:tetratricopeptide repeat protein [Verrucomicrobiota bacterium JB023]